MSYEVPYKLIHKSVESIVNSRAGMSNPKQAYTKRRIIAELTGYFIDVVDEFQIEEDVVAEYFDMTMNHNFYKLPTDGKAYFIHNYVNPKLFSNQLYYLMETILMNFKPASVQVGTGEFFLCWYDKNSVFGIDNKMNFDVRVSGLSLELKGLNSNLTASEEKFDNYMNTCDGIMVVKSYDNRNDKGELKNPLTRSFFCINTTNWKDSFQFSGQQGHTLTLKNQTKILAELKQQYKLEKAA